MLALGPAEAALGEVRLDQGHLAALAQRVEGDEAQGEVDRQRVAFGVAQRRRPARRARGPAARRSARARAGPSRRTNRAGGPRTAARGRLPAPSRRWRRRRAGVGGSGPIDQRPAVDLDPVHVDADAGIEGEAGSTDGDDRVVAVAVQRPQRRAQVGERPRLGLVGPQRAGDEQPRLGLAAQGQEGDQAARRIGDVDDGPPTFSAKPPMRVSWIVSLGRVRSFRLPRLLAHRRCDDGAAGRWDQRRPPRIPHSGGSGGGFRDGRRRRRSRGGRAETTRHRSGAFVARIWHDDRGLRARVRHTVDLADAEQVATIRGGQPTRCCPTSSAGSVAGRRTSSPMTTNRLVPLTAR